MYKFQTHPNVNPPSPTPTYHILFILMPAQPVTRIENMGKLVTRNAATLRKSTPREILRTHPEKKRCDSAHELPEEPPSNLISLEELFDTLASNEGYDDAHKVPLVAWRGAQFQRIACIAIQESYEIGQSGA